MAEEENKQEIKLPETEELVVSASPHLHDKRNISNIMLMVIISLIPACIAGVYFFGINAVRVMVLCTVFCVGMEFLWCKLAGQAATWKDGSAAVTGILLALNLNAGIPWWVCLVGAFLAIILGKQIYGGLGYNPFNPALVARVGLLLGFPKLMTTWMKPGPGNLMVSDAVTGATPLGAVKTSVETAAQSGAKISDTFSAFTNSDAYMDYFFGNVGGCLGETSALALLIGGIFLIAMKLIRWQVPLAYIGTVAVFTAIVHSCGGPTPGPLFHVLTGGLFLGAFFMATDMVTSPMTGKGALIFGIGCGIVTCVIRIWGSYPEGVSFSILFMNALVPLIDRFTAKRPFGYRLPEKGEA